MAIADDLERLAALHRDGHLSGAEYAAAKASALAAAMPGARTNAAAGWLNGLRRSRSDSWFGGVCGGLAPATGLPAWLWRLIFLALVVCGGTGFVAYLLLWILVPREARGHLGGNGTGSSNSNGVGTAPCPAAGTPS